MSVANSYGKALYEAAVDTKLSSKDLDALELQLEQVALAVTQDKNLRVALLSPALAAKDKVAIVEQLGKKAGFHPLVHNFLVLLARKGRMSELTSVREAFATARLEAEGGILGRVVSADPLEPSDLEGLASAFRQKLGKPVAFRTSTDPNLLAGMKVTVNGVTYDGTLRSQLQRLRDRLVFGTSGSH